MSGTPEWLDDKGKIIEHKYCRCFLEKQPMFSKGEDFFTTEGIVTEDIHNLEAVGRVKLGAMSWAARSTSGDPIPAGTKSEAKRS